MKKKNFKKQTRQFRNQKIISEFKIFGTILKQLNSLLRLSIKWLSGTFVIPRMVVVAGLLGSLVFLLIPQLLQKPPLPQSIIPTIDPSIPLNIEIPRIGLNLAIREATISANDWQVYDNAISWLAGSGNLKTGNIVLYGHNTKTLLGSIIKMGSGDQIILKGSSGPKSYIVENSYQTNRWDLSAITAKEDQLTIYTCSGWFDANRWFVIAKPLNSSI